jgi:biotin transport system substrate-specific component
MKKNTLNTQDFCMIGLITAIICIVSPLSIPLPFTVPMTLQTFIITFAAIILGAKRSAIATLLYVLLGGFGLPVFSNFTGGWQSLVGPTGGFLISFPLMAYIIGFTSDLHTKNKWSLLIGIIIGTSVNFICGITMFCFITRSSLLIGFTACVLPFIPVTIIKIVLSYLLGINIKKRIF